MALRASLRVAAMAAAALASVGASSPSLPPAASAVVAVYPTGVRDIAVEVGDRSFGARIHYPVDPSSSAESGPDAPLAEGRFPVIVFGHGYLSTVGRYESTLRDLASRGFLVVAPRSGDGLLPSHAAFARDFSTVLDWLESEDVRAGAWLNGSMLRGAYGASGHSMGGGVSLLAAAADPRFRTAANLAAAETRPSAVDAIPSITVPVLLIAGSQDAIAPVADHQQPMFDAKSTGPVALRILQGGTHCGFLDPDVLLALACDSGSMAADTQRAITVDLLADWFRHVLLADATLGPGVWSDVGEPLVGLQVKGR